MIRSVVASAIIAALIACGGDRKPKVDTSGPSGPIYSPSIANALRGIAPDCKLEKTPTSQTRDCRGRRGIVAIGLREDDHFASLTIALTSMILPEAKGHLEQPLVLLLGAEGRDKVFARLDKMDTGQNDVVVTGPADLVRVAIAAGGTSAIAPAYTLTITW